MSDYELRELIRHIVRDILSQQHRSALVLFTGALLGFDDATDALQRLIDAGWHLDAVYTDSARHVLDPTRLERLSMREVTHDLVADHDMLLIPTLTCNLAAKAAVGMGDCLGSNLVHQFLLQNRPIVAAATAADPDSTPKRQWFPHIPDAYADQLRANLAALRRYGVVLCDAASLDIAARTHLNPLTPPAATPAPHTTTPLTASPAGAAPNTHSNDRVIGQTHLARIPDGTTLLVPTGAIITDLARDVARSRQITIRRGAGEGA